MKAFIAKLKRLLEDRKYRIIDLKPGRAYFLWVKGSEGDLKSTLESIVKNLADMDIPMFVVISEEATIVECKD